MFRTQVKFKSGHCSVLESDSRQVFVVLSSPQEPLHGLKLWDFPPYLSVVSWVPPRLGVLAFQLQLRRRRPGLDGPDGLMKLVAPCRQRCWSPIATCTNLVTSPSSPPLPSALSPTGNKDRKSSWDSGRPNFEFAADCLIYTWCNTLPSLGKSVRDDISWSVLSGDVDRVTSSEASTTIALWFGVDVLIGGGMSDCLAANPFNLAPEIRW